MNETAAVPATTEEENEMKIILLFAYGGALCFCALGSSLHWSLRLVLGAAALLALLHELSRRAPVGYQDEDGFHYSHVGGAPRSRRVSLIGALLSPARSPLKA
jgi:hypothetical protein